ncbi:transcriptional regulator [Paenibacillus chungangensis]|uniref:Transcriptional regulator n=1 Tax=Paenibacillus chungangensis TaxID=696535 RepID=A0ABW3HWW3_9BACL
MEEQLKQSPLFWAAIALLLIIQSTWLFLDARKRNSMPWFWGIWGLIQCPLPLICYWLIVRRGLLKRGKRNGSSNGGRQSEKDSDGENGKR